MDIYISVLEEPAASEGRRVSCIGKNTQWYREGLAIRANVWEWCKMKSYGPEKGTCR
jgi:hypothetical protein